jgi:hypothetical protein
MMRGETDEGQVVGLAHGHRISHLIVEDKENWLLLQQVLPELDFRCKWLRTVFESRCFEPGSRP